MPFGMFLFNFFCLIFFLLKNMRVRLKFYLSNFSFKRGKGFNDFFNEMGLEKTEFLAIGRVVRDNGESFTDIL